MARCPWKNKKSKTKSSPLHHLALRAARNSSKMIEKDYVEKRSLRETRILRIPRNKSACATLYTMSCLLDSMELLRRFRLNLKPRAYSVSPRLAICTSLRGAYDFLKLIFGKPVKIIYRYRNHTVKRSIYDILSSSGRP